MERNASPDGVTIYGISYQVADEGENWAVRGSGAAMNRYGVGWRVAST